MISQTETGSLASPSVASSSQRTKGSQTDVGRDGVAAREYFSVLGVSVDAVQIPDVIRQMQRWITQRGRCRYIAVTGMHGITEARQKAELKQSLAEADLVVADGMPLVWIGRLRGHDLARRVYGPELMLRFCQETASTGCAYSSRFPLDSIDSRYCPGAAVR